MVLPAVVPLILASAGTLGIYTYLHKLYSRRRCRREYDGECFMECAYGEDQRRCVECLYTCGIPEEEHQSYYDTLLYPPPDVDYEYEEDLATRPLFDRRRSPEWIEDRRRRAEDKRRGRGRFYEQMHDETKMHKYEGNGFGQEDILGLQREIDEMEAEAEADTVGGGMMDMTQDTRGYRGVIVA